VIRRLAPLAFFLAACTFSASAQEPPQPPGPDRNYFSAQILRAIEAKSDLLIEQGKPDAAIEELRRAQAIELPKGQPIYEMKARLLGRLASLLAERGRKKEALETLQRLLADVEPGSPAEAAAQLEAGQAYRTLGMPDEALKAFDRAIELSQKLAGSARSPGRPGLPPPGRGQPPRGQPPRGEGNPRPPNAPRPNAP
jgi:tetratricopeptide (TPR) repeat protein